MNWIIKKFDDLNLHELYAILKLRNEVFIIEQNCIYPDLDNKDQDAWHFMGIDDNKLVTYTRILPPGVSYSEPAIGRVVTASAIRRSGLGKELMLRSIDICENLFGKVPISLGAQVYLIKFYESLGFFIAGDMYLEDGIEHIKMTRNASK